MSHALHITLAQINPIVGDLDFNLAAIRRVRDSVPATTDLILYPELALCAYSPGDMILKPFFLDQCRKVLRALVRESKDQKAWLVVPAPLARGGKIYNAAFVLGDGKIQSVVRKHHLPNYGVFDEKRIFSSAPAPAPVTIKGHKIGLMICEDTWFADVSRRLKDKGAELLISLNASPFESGKHDIRLRTGQARVNETGLPLIYLNQAGGQDDIVFDGASFVMNESGKVVLQAEEFVEDIHHTVWERSPTGHWLCGTGKITPTHQPIEATYQALMIGLRDYVTKNGFPGVLLGLSGGIDSALVAAIAADALGSSAVHGVLMPSKYTSTDSLEDAQQLAKNFGISADTISIERPVAAFEAELQNHFTPSTPSIAHENIQSRSRGLTLMAISNATGRMVLTTGNKSEVAVGYCTLYGDMCGGYNPLKDVYKTQVYELSRWRNNNRPDHSIGPQGKNLIPERSITKAPTAELRPNQKDQDSLPSYDVLDAILQDIIERDLGVDEIVKKGFDKAIVLKVWKLVDGAEYKRRQSAPGPKVTRRAFERERRYPITNRFKVGTKGKK